MYFTPRTDWAVGGKTFRGGSLLAINFEAFMKGGRDFTVLFEPTDRKSLGGFSPTKTKLILNELDNVTNRLYVLTPEGGTWKREELPGAAPLSSLSASAVDADESDDYFLTGSNYLTPSNLLFGTLGGKPPEKLKSGPSYFDASGLVVTQHEAVSKDGTKVPYFQVGPKGLKCDGTNPTLLYGYGGFEISMTPG